jgi:hypothetical protein
MIILTDDEEVELTAILQHYIYDLFERIGYDWEIEMTPLIKKFIDLDKLKETDPFLFRSSYK